MNISILVTASALSDQELLARLEGLAGNEREASAELVAHRAALDSRPALYAQGYSSLFSYCTQALRPCRAATPSLLGEPGPAPGPGSGPGPAMTNVPSTPGTAIAPSPSPLPPTTPRPIVRALAPERYRVQFTIGGETHEKLRRLQALLRREIPDGDPGAIFDRALTVLLDKVERTKLAAAVKPRPTRPIHSAADPSLSIRPAADREVGKPGLPSRQVPPAPQSRTVPREVKRGVWRRDAGQCAFVSGTGRRCTESTFLEYHHIQPYARQGPATVANISLRCWRHNKYEADLIFGPHGPSIVREASLP